MLYGAHCKLNFSLYLQKYKFMKSVLWEKIFAKFDFVGLQ